MNGKAFTISIQSRLSEFSRIMAAKKTQKYPYRLQIARLNFPWRGTKSDAKRKTESSLAFVVAFLAVENENQQPEDLPQADLAVYLRDLISSVGKDKVNTWEFCILQLHPLNCCICNYSTLFFTLILGDSALYDFCSGIVDRFVSFIITSLLFLSVKGYCVNIINKIIHGCL